MPTTKITAGGDVLLDGTRIGSVKKIDPTDPLHIRGEGMAARVSFSMKPMWYAFSDNGTPLNEHGYDTRKQAVRRVEDAAKPLVVTDVRIESYMGDPERTYIYANVEWEGNSASVSRYPGERAWVIDSFMAQGAFMPSFSNGGGTRYTRPHLLKDAMHNAANAAAVEAGLLAADEAIEYAALIEIAKAELAAKGESA